MAEASPRKNENILTLGGLIVPKKRDSLRESPRSDSEDDLMGGIEPSQLNFNLDHITPSLFIPQEDHRVAPAREDEQEISSSSAAFQADGGAAEDTANSFIRPQPNEESFEIPPPPPPPPLLPTPPAAPTIPHPPTSYLGFVPYSMYPPQQSPTVVQYPYSSTPFHAVIPYGYPQGLEMAPSHVQQLYMKRIFHHADYISPVVGAQHLSHGIGPHHSTLSNFASVRRADPSSGNENISNARAEQTFGHLERDDSGFSDERTTGNAGLPPSPAYISSEVVKEDLELKPFADDLAGERVCNTKTCSEFDGEIKGEADSASESTTAIGRVKTEWCRSQPKEFEPFIRERGSNRTLSESSSNTSEKSYYKEELFSTSSFLTSFDVNCNERKDMTTPDNDESFPLREKDAQRIRPEMYRKCKSLFQKTSTEDNAGTQLSRVVGTTRLKLNSNADLLSCSQCDYSSFNKSNFKNHLFIHSEERLFACPHCAYRGKQSAGLRAHLKVHSIEKPFRCSVCNYTCKRKQNLIQHLRIHSKYRPFLCSYCSYRSTTKQSLQKHMQKHFGEKCRKPKDKNNNIKRATATTTTTTTTASTTTCTVTPTSNSDDDRSSSSSKSDYIKKNSDDLGRECAVSEEKIVTSTQNNATSEASPIPDCSSCSHGASEFQNPLKTDLEYGACLFCNYKTKEFENLRLHLAGHKLNDTKCMSCDFHCDSSSRLASHMQLHKRHANITSTSDSPPFKNSFTTNERVGSFVLRAPSDSARKALQCPYCDFDVQSVAYLKLHITNHCDEDFWLFIRHPSSLVNERCCTARGLLKDCSQPTSSSPAESRDAGKDSQLEDKLVDHSESNVSVQRRGIGYLCNEKASKRRNKKGNNVEGSGTDSNVTMIDDYPFPRIVKKERVLASTTPNRMKSVNYQKVSLSARKNVFKSLRGLRRQKRRVIPAKNLLKINNTIKLASSKLINRLNTQIDCQKDPTVGTSKMGETKLSLLKDLKNNEATKHVRTKERKMKGKNCTLDDANVHAGVSFTDCSSCTTLKHEALVKEISELDDTNQSMLGSRKTLEKNLSPNCDAVSIDACDEAIIPQPLNYDPSYCNVTRVDPSVEPLNSLPVKYSDSTCHSAKNFAPPERSVCRSFTASQLEETRYGNYSGGLADFESSVSLQESSDVYPNLFEEHLNFPAFHPNDLMNFYDSSRIPTTGTTPSNQRSYSIPNGLKYYCSKYPEKKLGFVHKNGNANEFQYPTLSPRNWDNFTSNQRILKKFLLGGNYKPYEKREVVPSTIREEQEQSLREPDICTETFREGEVESNLLPPKAESSLRCGNLESPNEKKKFDSRKSPDSRAKDTANSSLHTPGSPSEARSDLPRELNVESKLNKPESYENDHSDLFKCNTCDSSFRRKSSLVNHKRSHVRDEFKCSKCPFTFRYKKAMEDHEKIHSKDKAFKCPQCNFSSLRKCSLMSHFRIHKRKFKCIYCPFKCSLIKKMEIHYMKHKQKTPVGEKEPSTHFVANAPQPSALSSVQENHDENDEQNGRDFSGQTSFSSAASSQPLRTSYECEIRNAVLANALDL